MNFDVSTEHGVKMKEGEKGDEYLDLVENWKQKTMEHKCDGDTDYN